MSDFEYIKTDHVGTEGRVCRPARDHVRRPSRDPQGQHESLLREHGNLLVRAQQYRPRRDGPVHRAHLPVPGHDARAWAQGRAGLARRTVQR